MSLQRNQNKAESFRKTRDFFFLSRRAHLLTTSSAQTSYPSPCRKRQVSSIPLCLLSPQNIRFCGDPFRRWYACGSVRSARRMRLLREPADNATVYLLSLSAQRISFRCLRKPAAGSFIAVMDRAFRLSIFFFRKRNKTGRTVKADSDLSFGSKGRQPRVRSLSLCCGGIYELLTDTQRL